MATNPISSTINAVRKVAVNTFGVDAFTTSGGSGLYNRARPSYPPQAIDKILSLLPNGRKAQVIEVGAGTGIFTSNFINHTSANDKIKSLIAIEPSSGMREAFNKNEGLLPYLSNNDAQKPNVQVKDGSFGEIPVPDGSVDIIVGAQCFHWAHPDYQSAITEFSRVLKPQTGILALIWNLEDRKTAKWVGGIRDLYEKYENDTPQYRLGWWKEMFNTQAYKDNFGEPEQFDYHLSHPTTVQGVVDRVWSKSYITAQSKEEQDKIAAGIKEILSKQDDGGDKKWIDEKEGVFEYPYETNLFIMKRK
ncbi:S-adenosyl-L-methionine-dependent methyltransferase [Cystobasidium minutum MCA 4210]|uniref:S-adenosyl-L-methionine-dependent methyltransferase n=1 Tax=Cystobasidium minutum MCA 4210 TaxID=1397322 RepID=UPI0034CFBBDA|eukprot:jgi/Rhomi1/206557/MIX7386_14622_61